MKNIAELIREDRPGEFTRAPHLALLYALATVQGPKGYIVELGTGPRGRSARAILATGNRLVSVDKENRHFETDGEIEFWQMDSAAAAEKFPPYSVSLLFVDAAHDYESVLRDLTVWENRMTADGIIVGHDLYLADPGQDGVARAVADFVVPRKRWEFQPYQADIFSFILWPQ